MAKQSDESEGATLVAKARDVALKKLPATPSSDVGRDARRRVSQVAEIYLGLDTRIRERMDLRKKTSVLKRDALLQRRKETETTLADLEKKLQASQRNGSTEGTAQVQDLATVARGQLESIDKQTRDDEQAQRNRDEDDRSLLASTATLAVAAIESVHRTDGAERFAVALKGVVAAGTIAGGFAYPLLAAAISAAQAAIDIATGSSDKRRLKKEDAATARQEAAVVILKTTEEILKAARQTP